MLHLTADRLAALADEHPTQIEAAHLAACPLCARERAAFVQLVALADAAGRRVPAAPLTTWEGVSAALQAAEGGGSGRRGTARWTPRGWRVPRHARQLLAASLLVAVGGVAGRLSAGGVMPAAVAARETLDEDARIAALAGDPATDFRSTGEALSAMAQAERQYQVAATFLAGHDAAIETVVDSSAVYRARLAALDEVMAATRAALYTAPFDPVINRYYLATIGAREVTVRQLGTVLPAGQSVTRF